MNDVPTRFPLAWPMGRPRKKTRVRGQFSEGFEKSGGTKGNRSVTLSTAAERLEDQVQRLGGILPILSTNVELRMDGRPRADRAMPADPGVCVYFQLQGKPYAMACDTYTEVAQNVAALAAHIEAMRRQERYGVATAAETLQAFQALPSPDHALPGRPPWRQTLGFPDGWPAGYSDEPAHDVQRRWRAKCIEAKGEAALADLNIARDAALKELN